MYKEAGPPRLAVFGEAGQVLLIVILVIIVVLTIGLSLATRSITSLRTSSEEADSQKALAAAEAGVERALENITQDDYEINLGESKYETEILEVENNKFLLNGGNLIAQNEGSDIWLADHNPVGNILYNTAKTPDYFHLYWGDSSQSCSGPSTPAALEVIAISQDPGGPVKSHRYAYDPCSRSNNFALAETGSYSDVISGKTFKYRTPQNRDSKDLAFGVSSIIFMRVIPVYKSTAVGASGCDHSGGNCMDPPLPLQGYKISSVGTSGKANRKVTVFKGFPQIYLPYLSYGLFVPKR